MKCKDFGDAGSSKVGSLAIYQFWACVKSWGMSDAEMVAFAIKTFFVLAVLRLFST